ncbi:MAG: SPOR domain-containing protein [Bacteroidales bacterium]|nr:SPOR domain-containing protein [Bacteroidales bacterium]
MAYLGKYIQEILSRNEPVILPGFGSLVVKVTGSNDTGGRIDPPGSTVIFDATHPRDDGKLAGEYAAGEGIDPEEARQQVLELIDAIKFKLEKGESFVLDYLGEFIRDENNKIHFRKSSDWVIDPDNFGLDPLELLEIENETEEAGVEQEEDEPDKVAAAEETDGEASQVLKVKKPVNKWKIIWIVVGSLIAVLVLILLIPAGNNNIEFGKEGIVIRDSGTAPETGRSYGVDEDKAAAAGQDAAATKEPEAAIPETPAMENNFFIIAGSFQNLQNAAELKDDLFADGFPAEIIYTENRMYRVAIQSYGTKAEAINDLSRVRRLSGIENAWVLSR